MASSSEHPTITDAEVAKAETRMAAFRRACPLAVAAAYDRPRDRIVVTLNTGLELAFPPRLAEGLEHALPDDLFEIEISPTGLGLHFPRLDADLYVPGLLDGQFGSQHWSGAEHQGRPAA